MISGWEEVYLRTKHRKHILRILQKDKDEPKQYFLALYIVIFRRQMINETKTNHFLNYILVISIVNLH